MIEKFASGGGRVPNKFLDLNHTSYHMDLVPLIIPKFAPQPSIECLRTSELGH